MTVVRTQALMLIVVLTGFVSGCATAGSGEAQESDVLTRDEIIAAQGAQNLHDVVQRLRPRWLRARAAGRSIRLTTQIAIFQDQSYFGDPDTLRQLRPSEAFELRYLDGPTASSTLSGIPSGVHVAGAIVVITRQSGY